MHFHSRTQSDEAVSDLAVLSKQLFEVLFGCVPGQVACSDNTGDHYTVASIGQLGPHTYQIENPKRRREQ